MSAFLLSYDLEITNLKERLVKVGLLGEVNGKFALYAFGHFHMGDDFPPNFGCFDATTTMPICH